MTTFALTTLLNTMKRSPIILLVAAFAMMICGSGCGNHPHHTPSQDSGSAQELITDTLLETSEEVTAPTLPADNETDIAFQIFQRIPRADLDYKFHDKTYTCPEGCTRTLILYEEDTTNGLNSDQLTVTCFPHDDGGWVAVLCDYGCFDICSFNLGKAYLYKDGELHEAPELIPMPPFEGKVLAPIFYVHSCDTSGLVAYVTGLQNNEFGEPLLSQETHYAWNGRRFVIDSELWCDMDALYEALFNNEEEKERQEYYQNWSFTVSKNQLHGVVKSLPAQVDALHGTLDVHCYPLNEGGFRVYLFENTASDAEGAYIHLEACDFIDHLLYWKDPGLGLSDDEILSVTFGEKTLQVITKVPNGIGTQATEFFWNGEQMRK